MSVPPARPASSRRGSRNVHVTRSSPTATSAGRTTSSAGRSPSTRSSTPSSLSRERTSPSVAPADLAPVLDVRAAARRPGRIDDRAAARAPAARCRPRRRCAGSPSTASRQALGLAASVLRRLAEVPAGCRVIDDRRRDTVGRAAAGTSTARARPARRPRPARARSGARSRRRGRSASPAQRVEDAVRPRVGAGAGDPLPVADVVRDVAVDEQRENAAAPRRQSR